MPSQQTPSFGDRLRESRVAAKLTQEALAERAGISTRAITDLERGVIRAPQRDTLDMLADALDASEEQRQEWHSLRRRLSARGPRAESPESASTQLPQPPNILVGRDEEVRDLVALLSRPQVRLVTVTGPGGVGKTRVALAVAYELAGTFHHGVRFIELAAIRDPRRLMPAIAESLGIREGEAEMVPDRLRTHLSQRHMLLVLDNLEHIPAAASDIAVLLASSAQLIMLLTSRAPLQIQAEQEYPLSPLAIGGKSRIIDVTEAESSPAVQLFVQRSQQVAPDFALTADNVAPIIAICSQLDGLPLAIELAAARTKVLTPREMLPRLSHRFEFLTEGAQDSPMRHRTMRAAIAWSYDLLGHDAQRLLRLLSTFGGGWTLEAAEAIAPGDVNVLDGHALLTNSSLIYQTSTADDKSRFRMLETIREFAMEQRQHSDERARDCRIHAEYFLDLAEIAEPELRSSGQRKWLEVIGKEIANFRVALEWSERDDVEPEMGLRLATALCWFWESRGHVSEGRGWITEALARRGTDATVRMRALSGAGWLAHIQRESGAAREYLNESLTIAQDIGDSWTIAWNLHLLGRVAYFDGDSKSARTFGLRSLELAQEIHDEWLVAWAFHLIGLAAHIGGDFASARHAYQASLDIREEIGYPEGTGTVVGLLGMLTLREGDHETALELFHESLLTLRDLGARWLVINMVANIVAIAAEFGELHRAVVLAGFVSATSTAIGATPIPIAEDAYKTGLNALRSSMTPADFDKAWDGGQRLSLTEAIHESLLVGSDNWR